MEAIKTSYQEISNFDGEPIPGIMVELVGMVSNICLLKSTNVRPGQKAEKMKEDVGRDNKGKHTEILAETKKHTVQRQTHMQRRET